MESKKHLPCLSDFGRSNAPPAQAVIRCLKTAGSTGETGIWSGKRDSNPQPSAWKADALPIELFPHVFPQYATGLTATGGRIPSPAVSLRVVDVLEILYGYEFREK